jgi:hypothetical protein
LFLTIMSGLFATTYLFVPLDAIILLHLHVQLLRHVGLPVSCCFNYKFLAYWVMQICTYFYHVLLCIHSLQEWDILMLGGQ